jgi:sec-independent protein translocase protein TatA
MGGIGPEWIVVGIVAVVVLFGAKKLPEIARSLGKSQSEFKKGLQEGKRELHDEDAADAARLEARRAEAARTEAARNEPKSELPPD